MRPAFLGFFTLLSLTGCFESGTTTGTGVKEEPAPSAPSAPISTPAAPTVTPQCVIASASICAANLRTSLDEPERAGAILWAQGPTVLSTIASGIASGIPKLAVYADGTVRRTPVLRDAGDLFVPPRGQIVGTLAPSSLAMLSARVASMRTSDAGAYAPPGSTLGSSEGAMSLVEFAGGRACFDAYSEFGTNHARCASSALAAVQESAAQLFAATEAKWLAAKAGTVSLAATVDAGAWPLADDLVKEGPTVLTKAQASLLVGGNAVFRLAGGDFVWLTRGATDANGDVHVSLHRMSAFVADDAGLRAELVANADRYVTSKGEWLGIPLDQDRFAACKGREIAIVPATDAAPEQLYWFKVLEHFDLRADGTITIPSE